MSDQERAQACNQALNMLREHFDAVQILATHVDRDTTYRCVKGFGNWYARQGMAMEFISEDKAQEQATQIANKLNPPEDV